VLRWGEHRGGMFVAVEGAGIDGRPLTRSWHLLAEGDDGPLIPSMAAEAIIRRCLEGRPPTPGARAAIGDLELADYEALFARRTIFTGIREQAEAAAPLYRRLLGSAWTTLPQPIRALHDLQSTLTAQGMATVERGRGWLARVVASLFRFPQAGQEIPVAVVFTRDGGRETWRRKFAGRGFVSTQEEGRRRFEHLLCERFGPLAFGLALAVKEQRLHLVVRGWSFLGIPLPLALAPGGEAFEAVDAGRFAFSVEIAHPWTGLIVRYRGTLDLVS